MSIIPASRLSSSDLALLGNNVVPARKANRLRTRNPAAKGTIYVKGQPVKELAGIYGLDLLRFLASALGVEYRQAMGRGFEAQNIQMALRQHLTPLIKSVSAAEPSERSR